MRTLLRLLLLLLALAIGSGVRAQGPIFAGVAPVLEGGIGYTYMRSDIPSEGTLPINGILLSGNADFSRRFGIKAELGYSRNFDAFNSGRTADLATYMGGPVFYPIRHRHYNVYTEALFGGARETGVNTAPNGVTILGFVNRFAWAFGGGVQYRVTPALSLRAGVDYLHTNFFNSTAQIQGQQNLRTAISVIYTFGGRE
jgi:opacity protein-like surface antigen